jgi:DNA-binding protein HU-beta
VTYTNKADLIKSIGEKTGLSKRDSEKAVKAFINTIAEALVREDKIRLVGFGTFRTKKRGARKVYNPKNKTKTKINTRTIPTFKAGKTLKSLIGK